MNTICMYPNNITSLTSYFGGTSNYTKNIYICANTCDTFYTTIGSNTYSSNWNTYLSTF